MRVPYCLYDAWFLRGEVGAVWRVGEVHHVQAADLVLVELLRDLNQQPVLIWKAGKLIRKLNLTTVNVHSAKGSLYGESERCGTSFSYSHTLTLFLSPPPSLPPSLPLSLSLSLPSLPSSLSFPLLHSLFFLQLLSLPFIFYCLQYSHTQEYTLQFTAYHIR